MKEIINNRGLKIDRIGFCYRGKDKDYEFACLVLDNGEKIVSTISFVSSEGLTVGEYLQGRIDDYYYCQKNKDHISLRSEFEIFDKDIHQINKTNTSGFNGDDFEKVFFEIKNIVVVDNCIE